MNTCLLCKQFFAAEINLIELFSPKRTVSSVLCHQCKKKFPRLGGQRCQLCDKELKKGEICQDCKQWQLLYHGQGLKNHAIYRYSPAFHDLMVNYKRYGDYCLKDVLQALIQTEIIKIKQMNFDYYVPVPTSPEHRARRKFDTVAGIFEGLLPLTKVLIKESGTSAQGEKSKNERLLTKQSFLIDKEMVFKDNIRNRRFLLLDDIYTTGRTLYHARDKLLECFPQAKIESFSICH